MIIIFCGVWISWLMVWISSVISVLCWKRSCVVTADVTWGGWWVMRGDICSSCSSSQPHLADIQTNTACCHTPSKACGQWQHVTRKNQHSQVLHTVRDTESEVESSQVQRWSRFSKKQSEVLYGRFLGNPPQGTRPTHTLQPTWRSIITHILNPHTKL